MCSLRFHLYSRPISETILFKLSLMSLVLITLIAYCIGYSLLWKLTQRDPVKLSLGFAIVIWVAILLHGWIIYRNTSINGELLLSLGTGISIAGWISALFYILYAIVRPVWSLGLFILPIAGLGLLTGLLVNGEQVALAQLSSNAILHIVVAIPAYGCFCLAFAQACLLLIQESRLKSPATQRFLPPLPAMESMERLLFFFTTLGFAFMSLNLIIGMIVNQTTRGQVIEFNHHVLLSIMAWFGFGCLLLGRKFAGWRGQTAAKWIISAFIVLFLAYFGTRFVNQVIFGNP